MRVLPSFSLVALSCTLPSCFLGWDDRYRAEETEVLMFEGEGVEQIDCATHNGAVHLVGQTGAKGIVVRATKTAGGDEMAAAEGHLRTIVVRGEVDGNRLKLDWNCEATRQWSASVAFEIEAPARMASNIETHNGAIDVQRMSGNVRATTHNGSIDVAGAPDEVQLTSHNGKIAAAIEGAGAVRGSVVTYNGSIRVELGEQRSTRVVASTHNGSVHQGPALRGVTKSRDHMVADVGDGKGELRIETHNGSVSVR